MKRFSEDLSLPHPSSFPMNAEKKTLISYINLHYRQIKNFILKAPDKKTFEILSKIGCQWPLFNEYKMSILLTYFVIFWRNLMTSQWRRYGFAR